jgi:hypothetical protein
MEWGDFKEQIETNLTVDADRMGTEDFIEQQIRACCIDLMQFIPRYRTGFQSVFNYEDAGAEGACSKGDLPENARVTGAWTMRSADIDYWDVDAEYSEDDIVRGLAVPYAAYRAKQDMSAGIDPDSDNDEIYWEEINTLARAQSAALLNTEAGITIHPCVDAAWEDRLAAVSNQLCAQDNNARLFLNPQAGEFMLFPKLDVLDEDDEQEWALFVLQYATDTIDVDIDDEDEVPFDEPCVFAVADYVKGELARHVDNDLSLYQSYTVTYMNKRRKIYLRAQELGKVNE